MSINTPFDICTKLKKLGKYKECSVYERYRDKQIEAHKENNDQAVFNIVGFIKDLGLKALETKQLDDGISGYIKGQEIVVNAKQAGVRKAFTLAHEVSHYILGHGDKVDVVRYRKSDYDISPEEYQEEVQANEYAAQMLMPKEIFVEKFEQEQGEIIKLADYFGTSVIATAIRAKKLGLISEEDVWTV